MERRQRLGDLHELAHGQRLAAGQRLDAGALQGSSGTLGRPGQLAQRTPQRLASLGERRIDHREDLLAGRGRGRRVAAGPGHEPRVHVGRRPEDVAANRPRTAYVGEPGRLHRRDAVDLGAGAGRQPVGDLGLHHHQSALERGQQGEQVEQHGHGDVVGEVGDQRGRRRRRAARSRAWRRRAPPRSGRPGRARRRRRSRGAATPASRRARPRSPGGPRRAAPA